MDLLAIEEKGWNGDKLGTNQVRIFSYEYVCSRMHAPRVLLNNHRGLLDRVFTNTWCLSLDKNPAYEVKSQSTGDPVKLYLHNNPAYEGSTLPTSELDKQPSIPEPTYEPVLLLSTQLIREDQRQELENMVSEVHVYEIPDRQQPNADSMDGKSMTASRTVDTGASGKLEAHEMDKTVN